MKGLQHTMELVTPELAKKYLSRNRTNRKLEKAYVALWINQILTGNWKQTGDPIRFDIKGNLIDGQHRLTAIVKTGIAQFMLVVTGLPEDAKYVIDTGKKRTASDVLSISGIKNPGLISSVIKMYLGLKNADGITTTDSRMNSVRYKTPNNIVLAEYQSNPDLWQDVVPLIQKYYNAIHKSVTPAWIGGWYAYLASMYGKDKVTTYFDNLCINRGKFESTDAFFNLLMKAKISKSFKLTSEVKEANMIRTFNSFIENKPFKNLIMTVDDEFPKLKVVVKEEKETVVLGFTPTDNKRERKPVAGTKVVINKVGVSKDMVSKYNRVSAS